MYSLFVYGTLLEKDNVLNNILESVSYFSTPTYFNGKMYSLGNCPFVISSTDINDRVYGMSYFINDDWVLDFIDSYENYNDGDINNFYTREYVTVINESNSSMPAWIYLVKDRSIIGFEQVTGGDWIAYKNKKQYM